MQRSRRKARALSPSSLEAGWPKPKGLSGNGRLVGERGRLALRLSCDASRGIVCALGGGSRTPPALGLGTRENSSFTAC